MFPHPVEENQRTVSLSLSLSISILPLFSLAWWFAYSRYIAHTLIRYKQFGVAFLRIFSLSRDIFAPATFSSLAYFLLAVRKELRSLSLLSISPLIQYNSLQLILCVIVVRTRVTKT